MNIGVKTSKQVENSEDMLNFWKHYVEAFNPDVQIEENETGIQIHGTEKAYQHQYGRNAPKELGNYPLEGQVSHITDFKMVFGKDEVSLCFDDHTRIGPTLFDDWKPTVETFASKYNLTIQKIVDEMDKPRSAVLSYA